MTRLLTPAGYEQTKAKLASLESRLAKLEALEDLEPLHHSEVRQSYRQMIREYRREVRLYEASVHSRPPARAHSKLSEAKVPASPS